MRTLAKEIKKLRVDSGHTQAEFAKYIGLSVGKLSAIENCTGFIPVDILNNICTMFLRKNEAVKDLHVLAAIHNRELTLDVCGHSYESVRLIGNLSGVAHKLNATEIAMIEYVINSHE